MRTFSPRLCGVVFLTLGVVIGTFADRIPDRPSLRVGDYWVLSGDFHVHAFPGDGVLLPWTLRREAARAGLDVIAVTNHNQVFTGRLARWVSSRSEGPIMIAGQEITNPGYHMIGAGLDQRINATCSSLGVTVSLVGVVHPIRLLERFIRQVIGKSEPACFHFSNPNLQVLGTGV
jgi:hypothetical protein